MSKSAVFCVPGPLPYFIMAGSTNGDTSTLTVCADSDALLTGGTAMAFHYRTLAAAANPVTTEAWSALTACAATGLALTGTTYKCWMIEVTAEEVAAALDGANFAYIAFADAGTALTGSAFYVLSEPRFPGALPMPAIV